MGPCVKHNLTGGLGERWSRTVPDLQQYKNYIHYDDQGDKDEKDNKDKISKECNTGWERLNILATPLRIFPAIFRSQDFIKGLKMWDDSFDSFDSSSIWGYVYFNFSIIIESPPTFIV